MLNHEGSRHEHFEELCALAASGQISEPDFVELQDHLQQCVYCQSTYTDFIELLHDKLPLADPDVVGGSKLTGFFSENSSYRERFLARVRKEGVTVSAEPSREIVRNGLRPWFWLTFRNARFAAVAVAVLLVTVGLLSYSLYESNTRYERLASGQAELTKQLSQRAVLENSVPEESNPTSRPRNANVPTTPVVPSAPGTEAELAKVRGERAAAETRSEFLQDQLAKVASELEALRGQSEAAAVSREELEKKLSEAEQLANGVREELEQIRQARSKDSVTIAAQNLEIQNMSDKLSEQTERLEQESALLEASRDVRDLMGSRNFHIADVYDVDSKGKDQQAFGRVFYTEGKSTLIFYAFDLNDRSAAKRNASFQVWGKRGPAQAPTHSLGLFQIDDQKQNRWVLRFEDPQVLAEIDSVFVTVEPLGGSAKPTGRQFLYAYLNANPNRQ
jgi:Anti-sigma-K factor rskA, C-terminal